MRDFDTFLCETQHEVNQLPTLRHSIWFLNGPRFRLAILSGDPANQITMSKTHNTLTLHRDGTGGNPTFTDQGVFRTALTRMKGAR